MGDKQAMQGSVGEGVLGLMGVQAMIWTEVVRKGQVVGERPANGPSKYQCTWDSVYQVSSLA
jgi:hypothetical protein